MLERSSGYFRFARKIRTYRLCACTTRKRVLASILMPLNNYFPASLVNGSFFRAEVNLSKSRIRSITSCHASCLWLICITLGHHKHCWWCCPLVRFLHSPMCLLCMFFFGSIHINYLCETVGKCSVFIVKEPFCLPCLRYYHVIIAWKSGKCTWKMQCFSILIIDAVWE